MNSLRLFISAGDPSGDMHAANLASALRSLINTGEKEYRKYNAVEITAIGGHYLKEQSDNFIADIASLGVMGFWEPVKNIFFFRHLLKKRLAPFFKESKPHAVIVVDFYGFNIHVARLARNNNIPVFYYISPQVWASRENRMVQLKKVVNRMFVIFPFEEKIYRDKDINVSFVGHPLMDMLPDIQSLSARMPNMEPVIGLFPGSRRNLIARHLSLMIDTVKYISAQKQRIRVVVFASKNIPAAVYQNVIPDRLNFFVELLCDEHYRMRTQLDAAIASSGTVTLENALLGIPTVVIYRTSWPTYLLANAIIKVKYIAMPNILYGKEIFPEFVQHRIKPRQIGNIILNWLGDKKETDRIKAGLLTIRKQLGEPGGVVRTAEAILNEV